MTEETQQNNKNQEAETNVTETPGVTTTIQDMIGTQEKAIEQPTNRMLNMMVGIVGVLVIMAGIQVFQTQQLMAAVSSGSIKAGAPQTQQSSGLGVQSQVGGCG